jgi:zinc protease
VSAVTPEQVQAVAKKYLVDADLTVAVLDPLPTDKDTVVNDASVGVQNER